MKIILRSIIKFLSAVGIDPIKLINSFRGIPSFILDYIRLKKQSKNNKFPITFYPVLDDKYKQGGTAKGHYFHQDLLVAQKVYKNNPEKHIDIGSKVDSFIAHIITFRKVIIIDIREIKSKIENIEFLQANMINMKVELFESCDSLSCLHALEHFGLGRYGDPIDYDGHLKGFENMYNILKPNGLFYFSVPIGKQRLEFNAHRVFSINYLFEMFDGRFVVESFSYVDDEGDLHKDTKLNQEFISHSNAFSYACGIFELRKININN